MNEWTLPLLTLLLGGGLSGSIVALRKDRREKRTTDVDLVERIRKLANEEVTRADDRLENMQKRLDAMEREREAERVEREREHAERERERADVADLRQCLNDERRRSQAMERALRDAGIPIPPWPPEDQDGQRPERRKRQVATDFPDRRGPRGAYTFPNEEDPDGP